MKKLLIMAIILSLALTLAACGGNEKPEAAQPTETPQPTELPSVTAPPAEGDNDSGMLSADENKAPDADLSVGASNLDSEEAKTAFDLMGKDVSELIKAIGEPKSSEYTASCIAPGSGAEDGLLYYDDFTVATLRYPNGQETIMGVF